jgi:hypothetical protein
LNLEAEGFACRGTLCNWRLPLIRLIGAATKVSSEGCIAEHRQVSAKQRRVMEEHAGQLYDAATNTLLSIHGHIPRSPTPSLAQVLHSGREVGACSLACLILR